MMITTVQCVDLLPEPEPSKEKKDEFSGPFYQTFRKILRILIKVRFLTLGVLVGMLVLFIFGFGFVKQMFFPDSSRPQLMVDYWAPEGTRVQDVSQEVAKLEKIFYESPLTSDISAFIGAGPPRFYLPVDPEGLNENYAQMIINFPTYENVNPFIEKFEPWVRENVANALVRFRKYGVGPADTWKFEAKVSGPAEANLEVLRKYGDQIQEIAESSPYGKEWRLDMMNRTMKVVSEYDQKRGRWSSITRNDIANTTKRAYDGITVGQYRERMISSRSSSVTSKKSEKNFRKNLMFYKSSQR